MSDAQVAGFIEFMHISEASLPIISGENASRVLEQIAPIPLTGLVPLSESAFIMPAMYVDFSEQFNPRVFIISNSSETIFSEPEILVICLCIAEFIIVFAMSIA